MAGARSIGGADIDRATYKAGIEACRCVCRGKPHHRCRSGEARHVVAAERLVQSLVHQLLHTGMRPQGRHSSDYGSRAAQAPSSLGRSPNLAMSPYTRNPTSTKRTATDAMTGV